VTNESLISTKDRIVITVPEHVTMKMFNK